MFFIFQRKLSGKSRSKERTNKDTNTISPTKKDNTNKSKVNIYKIVFV